MQSTFRRTVAVLSVSALAMAGCAEHNLALAPEAASSFLLPRQVGRQSAAWILMSSEWITAAEARLDGIYVLRTSVPASDLTPAGVVESYKNLAHIERDFRVIKVDDLDQFCFKEHCSFCRLKGECSPTAVPDSISACCAGLRCALKSGFTSVYECQ